MFGGNYSHVLIFPSLDTQYFRHCALFHGTGGTVGVLRCLPFIDCVSCWRLKIELKFLLSYSFKRKNILISLESTC